MVLVRLRARVRDLASRWAAQEGSSLLPEQDQGRVTDHLMDAEGLVTALIAGLDSSNGDENTVGHGLRFGATSFERGVSLHHVGKALDLLTAMTLFATERILAEIADGVSANAADGVRISRGLQRRASLLSLAVTQGYVQAYAGALRERFRHLRHDLRNPLGTIKSVLALMDDESVPLEARVNPTFRAMATRNAKSLEELIADQLSDAAALLPMVAGQDMSIRTIACAVRRELRSEAEQRGVNVHVEQGGPHGQLDAAGVELLLREVLRAALRECGPGEQVRVDFEQPSGRGTVIVSRESGEPPIRDGEMLTRVAALAAQIGATISFADRVVVTVPLRSTEGGGSLPDRERKVPRDSTTLGDGQPRHDVRGAREGHHGQTGAN
jgi:signal transduction histidine kinase